MKDKIRQSIYIYTYTHGLLNYFSLFFLYLIHLSIRRKRTRGYVCVYPNEREKYASM